LIQNCNKSLEIISSPQSPTALDTGPSRRAEPIPAIYVGEGESSTFFGGPPMVYTVIQGADHPVAVEFDRVTGR